jgi:hypothetical protein
MQRDPSQSIAFTTFAGHGAGIGQFRVHELSPAQIMGQRSR